MILKALTDYYEALLQDGKAAKQGWCQAKVAFALNLDQEGRLKGVNTLKEERERGKRKVWIPSDRTVPQMVTRSSGVSANFLCDNSKYILGVDAQGCGDLQGLAGFFKSGRRREGRSLPCNWEKR